ncbi:MAG: hypothetical protein ACFFAH_15015 [Promethearchaeota archaeon]
MALTNLQIITGISSILILIAYQIVGLLIILKYRKFKDKTFIWWGIGILGVGLPWAGSGISFLFIIITGKGLTEVPYFFITLTWMAITLFFWMWTMTELMAKEKQKIILGIYAFVGIMFDLYLILNLITNPSAIGMLHTPPIDSTYIGLTMLYTLFVIASTSISLFIFIMKSFKSENPEVKLKAYFLLIALISQIFAGVADAFIELTITTLIITRIIIISSAIEGYIGWVLPEPIKKLFIKK